MRGRPKALLGLLAVVALLLAALPWWLGAALVPIGRHFYVQFGRYERIGYARFALTDVVFDHKAVRVTARRVAVDTPLLWLWRHLRSRDAVIMAENWQVTVRPVASSGPPAPNGMAILKGRLDRIALHLRRWLPRAKVTGGSVHWPTGGFALQQADWERGALSAHGLRWSAGAADVKVAFSADDPIQIEGAEADRDWRVQLSWSGPEASGRGWVWSQPVDLRGHYGPTGWLPQTASATASAWTIPADKVGLGAAYDALRGAGQADWDGGRFHLRAQASAAPKASGGAPPASVDIAGEGDRRSWSVQSLRVSLPYAELALNRPIAFEFGRRVDWTGAELAFQGDLSRLPGAAVRGRAAGTLTAAGGAGNWPAVNFSLRAQDLAWRQVVVTNAQLRGTLQWPRLSVSTLELRLPAGEVSGAGAWDFRARTLVEARLQGALPGAALAPWIPADVAAEKVEFSASATGAPGDLVHAGEVRVTGLRYPPWRAADVSVVWKGRGEAAERCTVRLTAGATTAIAAGSLDRSGARLDELRFAPGGVEIWHLDQAASVRWAPFFRLENLRLRGAGGAVALDISGGPAAAIAATASGFRSEWARDLIALPGPGWLLRSLQLNGRRVDGRWRFSARTEGDVTVPEHTAQISFALDGDENGLRLSDGKLMEHDRPIAQAEGRAPIWWGGEGAAHWGWNPEGALALRIDTTPGAPFWSAVAGSFGLVLDQPQASVHLEGTLRHPEGRLDLNVARLASGSSRATPVPALDNVSLQVRADADGIVLDHLTGSIAGQSLQAAGRLPMSERDWRDLWQRRSIPDWTDADLKLDVAEADLAPLAGYFPEYLSSRGRWSLHAALAGGRMSGELHVRGAAGRPVIGLGQVQEINADVRWHDRIAELSALTAQIGGQPVRLEGKADFSTWSSPRLAFTLHGDDIPLVRQPELLVRADLDLRADTNPKGITLISGGIKVRDAIQLGALADLLPSTQTGATRAPPYFSVDARPFNRWQLGVDATADGTLRIRTSLFSGRASAAFRLTGTLGEPRAVGQITLQQGQISLPFAAFDVQNGAVRLTADDPYHPQIDLTATSRRYDYDLRMVISGSALAPTVNFTSNPALPSDQVVLLVTTGQVPTLGTAYANPSAQVAGLGAFVGQNLFQGLGSAGSSNRLDVTAGQELSLKGRPTYEVDYKLRDRWWVVGEYDEFDEYIGGVKWRVYTGGAAHAGQ